jgi:hypothetical protein
MKSGSLAHERSAAANRRRTQKRSGLEAQRSPFGLEPITLSTPLPAPIGVLCEASRALRRAWSGRAFPRSLWGGEFSARRRIKGSSVNVGIL